MPYLQDLGAELGDRLRVHVSDEGTRLDVAALVRRIAADAPGTEVHACGPLGLLDELRAAWARAGLPPTALRYETFGTSGRHEAQAFEVRVPRWGLTTRVGAGSTVLEALQAAGADLMYDCLKGECGLCVLPVRATAGTLDHRDVFLSDEQKAAGDRLCVCVSRVTAADGSGVVTLDVP
nr:iron-sulfur cluster-binding domain-containing protein [Kineococcus aurantiacus]